MSNGIVDTFGLSALAGAYVNESRRSRGIEKAIVTDEDGDIKKLRGKKLITEDVTIRGKGSANFAAVVAGAFTVDTVKPIEAEQTEYHDGEFPDFEMVGKAYRDVGNVAAGGTGTINGTFGITSIATALVEQFRKRKRLKTTTPVQKSQGGFHSAHAYGEEWEFDVKGRGAFPADFALGGSGPTVVGFTGGVTLVESTDEAQTSEDEPTWEASGTHAPNAVAA